MRHQRAVGPRSAIGRRATPAISEKTNDGARRRQIRGRIKAIWKQKFLPALLHKAPGKGEAGDQEHDDDAGVAPHLMAGVPVSEAVPPDLDAFRCHSEARGRSVVEIVMASFSRGPEALAFAKRMSRQPRKSSLSRSTGTLGDSYISTMHAARNARVR